MADKIDHIAELQSRLYARDPDNVPKQKFGILRPLKDNVDSTWGEKELNDTKIKKRTNVSGYKRLFLVSLIFFVGALGVALYSVYKGAITLSSKNVEVSILGNSFVAGGESLPIQVDITNKNSSDLVETQLTLSYPKGSTDAAGGDLERVKKPLGTIGSGKTKTEGFSVILYGEQGTSRLVTATLEYKLGGSNATFVKEKTFSVMINSSPVSLTVDAPSSVTSNQPFIINIRTVFTGDILLDNAIVKIEYPNGFIFQSAIPSASSGANTWDLGDLVKGTERTISIKGKLVGEQQDEKSFRVYVGSRTSETDSRIAVSYNSSLRSVVIAEPFISGQIFVNGDNSDIVALPNGSSVAGSIDWKNNAPISIINPEFVLSIAGDNVDTDSIIAPGGYYDKLDRTITWNNETNLAFGKIESGTSGKLPFSFNTKEAKSGMAGDITLSLSVKGTFPDRDFFQDSVSGIDQKTIRFASRLQFAAQALYSIGPIKNSGPFPSRFDQDTTYTIQWFMRPVENPLNNAVAIAVLPIGVVWTGVISPQSEAISYAPETRVVTWNIGPLPKATNTPVVRTVSFQVKVRPNKSQIDSRLYLLGETKVQAVDSVANTPLTFTRPELTNELSTDPIYSVGKEKVLP
jgi:hypothetical protein